MSALSPVVDGGLLVPQPTICGFEAGEIALGLALSFAVLSMSTAIGLGFLLLVAGGPFADAMALLLRCSGVRPAQGLPRRRPRSGVSRPGRPGRTQVSDR